MSLIKELFSMGLKETIFVWGILAFCAFAFFQYSRSVGANLNANISDEDYEKAKKGASLADIALIVLLLFMMLAFTGIFSGDFSISHFMNNMNYISGK